MLHVGRLEPLLPQSAGNPSIQLADLLAGATAAIAARHVGTNSPAAEDLLQVVLPLVENESLLPYDSADALARTDAAE